MFPEPAAIPDALKETLEQELKPGEQLRWVGQPIPRAGCMWFAIFPIFFGLFFAGFAVFWIVSAFQMQGNNGGPGGINILFALWGIPFVLVGLGIMSSPYWMRRRYQKAALRTIYAVTDQRAIIIDGGYMGDSPIGMLVGGMTRWALRGSSIRTYTANKLGQITRHQRDDGSGDVLFGEILYTSEQSNMRQIQRDGFFSVPNVKDVEDQIKALSASQTGSS